LWFPYKSQRYTVLSHVKFLAAILAAISIAVLAMVAVIVISAALIALALTVLAVAVLSAEWDVPVTLNIVFSLREHSLSLLGIVSDFSSLSSALLKFL
jgi:uncharacterized metal-binding protein